MTFYDVDLWDIAEVLNEISSIKGIETAVQKLKIILMLEAIHII